ncbi:MAG: ArnT family glycosyltransferase [Acidobacteriaceae bacterium]
MEVSVEELPDTHCGDRGTSTAPAPLHAPAQNSSTRPYIRYSLFALCAAIYLLPFMRVILIGGDEGSFVDGAVRILHGQVFARDFFEVMGPGTFYLLAGIFKLFGATFLADRIWLFVTSLGTVLSMYFLSRRICSRYQVLPAVLLMGVYFGMLWPMVNHHVDSNFFALLSVVCMVLWQDTRKHILLLATGAGAAVTTCILQPKGILLIVAFFVWLWVQQRRRSASFSALGLILASYSSVIAVVLLYFWSRGALRDLMYMDFVWPSQHYGAVNAIPYATGIVQYWNHWVVPIHGVRWLIPLAVVLVLPFLFIAALPVLALVLGIPRGKENLRPEILLYWFCGWALWLSEFHRRDIAHLASGSPLLIILCVYFFVEYRGKVVGSALQLLAISAGALAVVNLFIALTAHSIPTRVGLVGMWKPSPALTFLNAHAAPGSEIFVYPNCPMYYFLSGTTNPTRYSLLMYNYNTPSQFQEVIRVLDQHKVRYVLWNTDFERKASPYFSAAMYRPAGGFIMEPYLESHYRVVQDFNGMRIMERKADDHAGH